MEYILQNWGDLNLIDRAWFLAGAWLLLLFLGGYLFRMIQAIRKNKPFKTKLALTQDHKKPIP
jgi:hypothetical protein